MAVYDTPYYGQRRKALTGMGYGPYYGMSLTGGGALPTEEGRRALPPEISDKYQATGTPAITGIGEDRGGGEGIASPALEGSMATTPGASWAQVAYFAGLPGGKAPPGTAQPKGLMKGVMGVAPTVASKLTGIPGIAFTQVVRNFINPLLSKAFPNLFTSDLDISPVEAMLAEFAQVASTSIVGPEGATFGVGALGNVGLTGIGQEGLGGLGFATGEGFGGEGEGEGGGGFGGEGAGVGVW